MLIHGYEVYAPCRISSVKSKAILVMSAFALFVLAACGQSQTQPDKPAKPANADTQPVRPAPPAFGQFDPATTRDIDVAGYPVLPEITPAIQANLRATFELVWLSGWTPHASQQKPLRPGSAKVRLADALGVREQRLDED